ncbi:MAG: hypothetical protein LCH85_22205 [Chloroflexi bacterium]|nr:hypothetical protein [Chloroflexota bacterium]
MSTLDWNQHKKTQVLAAITRAIDAIDQQIVAKAMTSLVPGRGVKTGTLRRSINAKAPRTIRKRIVGVVGTDKSSKQYALRIHNGWKPRPSRAKKRNPGMTKGFKGIPFLSDAMREVSPNVMPTLQKHLKDVL